MGDEWDICGEGLGTKAAQQLRTRARSWKTRFFSGLLKRVRKQNDRRRLFKPNLSSRGNREIYKTSE